MIASVVFAIMALTLAVLRSDMPREDYKSRFAYSILIAVLFVLAGWLARTPVTVSVVYR